MEPQRKTGLTPHFATFLQAHDRVVLTAKGTAEPLALSFWMAKYLNGTTSSVSSMTTVTTAKQEVVELIPDAFNETCYSMVGFSVPESSATTHVCFAYVDTHEARTDDEDQEVQNTRKGQCIIFSRPVTNTGSIACPS